ncbi:hypothetical protein OKA04_10315 [Luteolibacter flavescens]|uniref:Verru_Chthon cassette protein A n=1 Tax=Luteolibacter flavescens TaxID=1859460 RepID=A0ABT3FNI3_9BACT|nr:hypothetical protein [Luteolibacter flavescens]MCW1885122.1 hypothetical protein [Luteolibacter flavescens]
MTTSSRNHFPIRQRQPRGFALIISLSLMVLIMVLVTGLIGLSTISLRGGSRDEYAAQARANARMALSLAIGQLQKQAGADTRVTARADILNENNPPVLGVWKSWEGTNHDSKGRPISPGNYASKKEARFLGWMTSGPDMKTMPDTKQRMGSVALLGERTVGTGTGREKLQVHLDAQSVTAGKDNGGFAWWIGGENQKARLPKPHKPEEDTAPRWAVVAKSHAVADPKPLRMEELINDPTLSDRTVSLMLSDLVADKGDLNASQEFFHDLSTTSTGLLTNTATGGWRKDLSLVTENWASLPSSNLPFFRLTPERDGTAAKATSNPTAERSMLYPWASYRGGPSDPPMYRHGPVSSWENLRDYATLYKTITSSSTGRNRIASNSISVDATGNAYNFLHRVRRLPLVARVQWVFSHYATTAGAGGSGETLYNPRMLLTPVVTMWNPYSVELSSPTSALHFSVAKPLPVALRYTVGSATNTVYNSLTSGNLTNTPSLSASSALRYRITTQFTLKPGEARVFSPSTTAGIVASDQEVELQPGFRHKGGHFFDVKNSAGQTFTAPGSSTIKADAKFDTTYDDGGQTGVGIYLDMNINNERHLVYRMTYTPTIANEVYKPLTQLASATLAASSTNPVPFMATVFGARMASNTHLPAKGFVQSSPLVNYTAMGSKDIAESTIGIDYSGTNHPVNSPFDYSFTSLSANDSMFPNSNDTKGYIVTGFSSADGLSRCVIAEIPVRPLASLAELQNWDLRYENPIPPFAFNLIGNSDASPLLPANAVVNTTYTNLATNLQHDDSYCANHVLFDDWFFSSIAPDPNTYGNAGKNLQTTYTSFVSGTSPLANRAYHAITEDKAFAAAAEGNANTLYDQYVRRNDAYRNIASRFDVEGMFNVNSTSVVAWRALLGHARNQRVPFIRDSGSTWNVDLSGETNYAVSRFSIAGDVEAGKSGGAGIFPEATEFAGYRVLDEEFIDQLAEEIVKQVRARGPFLSLAEFVNRQLSSGDLALAGAVQAAMNEASKGSANPFAEMEALMSIQGEKASASKLPRLNDAAYRFPAAAEGWSAYGLPGWTRQADILRPIAPILSARDDTFVIRAHGDARDEKGNVVSRAVCEAIVRRTRDYVDSTDAADLVTPPKSDLNKTFGRRFEVVSFRWLNPAEI